MHQNRNHSAIGQSRGWDVLSRIDFGQANIGLAEVVAFAQKGLLTGISKGIGKAVAIVQPRGMAAFAEAAPGAASDFDLIGIDGDDVDAGLVKPQIEFMSGGLAAASFQDHCYFEHRCGRYQPHRVTGDKPLENSCLRLIERDGHYGGSVNLSLIHI